MLTRRHGNLRVLRGTAPAASEQLEREGYALIRDVLDTDGVAALGAEIADVFEPGQ